MKILNSKFKTNLTEFYPSLNEVKNSSLFNIWKKKRLFIVLPKGKSKWNCVREKTSPKLKSASP